jgi:UDP-3-O-[3-hydroxymyristoyl] N-acetylglucosamine deacetylase
MIEKRTLGKEVILSGIGIHSGEKAALTLKPSSRGKILFRRTDLNGSEIEVAPQNVEIKNCVTLVSGAGVVQTIEHLMAVLYVFGIDSLEIELNGPEIPVLDGSAAPFARAVLQAGIIALPEKKKAARILKTHTLRDKLTSLSFFPDKEFRIAYSIDFAHPVIRRQKLSLILTQKAFLDEIAPARTFGFLRDLPELQKRGLAQGGGLENAVVLDDDRVISGPLRFPDEFVRHKILDLIGDLALFGHPWLGHFQADRAGHSLHLKAVCFLLENPDFWAFDETAFPRHLRS